ncbi:hypothetical protein MVEN_01226900 [Mycena venus]|uniref:F-box domain-containing protein n=1 Tax=Mycena venus TaxID=2733690 RepID=A0A8H7CW17_9AGAR|nr:hypothetical protein MVEN_01226900 [Mycena venus]
MAHPSPPGAAQLLDLPNELVLLILGHLTSEALLYLSTLCRRLHHLSLPMYFEINRTDDPTQNSKVTMLHGGRDCISALQMALFISSLATLSCSLPHYETIHPLFGHIRRLRALITRLDFVREVTLVLDTPESLCGADGDGAETWALEFGQLLNTILKRGCTSLTLRYGRFFSEAYELRPQRLIGRPVNAFRNAVRHILPDNPSAVPSSDGWEVWDTGANARMVPMELDAEGCSASTLTHFKVESSILLIPPCFSWSLSALRHSPITTLEFAGVTLPAQNMVGRATPNSKPRPRPNVAHPLQSLQPIRSRHFTISVQIIPPQNSHHRLHRIQSAHPVLLPDSAAIPKLPELTDLTAPSTFILHFLRKKSALPRLQALSITPRRLILGFRGVRHIGRSVSDIVRRLEKHALAPVVSLEIHRGHDSDAGMAADLALPPREELMKALRAITRLIIYSERSEDLSGPELGTLARWIARFPALVHVSLRVRGGGGGGARGRMGHTRQRTHHIRAEPERPVARAEW